MLQRAGPPASDAYDWCEMIEPPVARVGERRDGVRLERVDRVGQEQQRVEMTTASISEQRGSKAPGAPDPERVRTPPVWRRSASSSDVIR
jgi:hypothetical protein